MTSHDGVLPSTADGLLSIDGIGPYSAGAISSIAFGQRSPVVDGNVVRVLSRLTALHAPDKAKSTANFVWALADVLVPPQPRRRKKAREGEGAGGAQGGEGEDGVGGKNKPGAWNQALMELGATVCTPKAPKCDECPLSDECLAYAEVRRLPSLAPLSRRPELTLSSLCAQARYVAHRPKPSSSSTAPEPDIEDLCTLCSPLPYESAAEARAHGVEVYPMAKEKTKKRDEDSVVCVVEWVASEGDKGDEERKVLLVKRPEKGASGSLSLSLFLSSSSVTPLALLLTHPLQQVSSPASTSSRPSILRPTRPSHRQKRAPSSSTRSSPRSSTSLPLPSPPPRPPRPRPPRPPPPRPPPRAYSRARPSRPSPRSTRT